MKLNKNILKELKKSLKYEHVNMQIHTLQKHKQD